MSRGTMVGAGVVEQEDRSASGVEAYDGPLQIVCPEANGWAFSLERSRECGADVEEWRLALSREAEAEPPEFSIELRTPKTDMQYCWTPVFGCNGRIPLPQWARWFAVQCSLPIVHRFNDRSRNRLTLAVDEARRDIEVGEGFGERDFCVVDRIKFFGGVKDACANYSVSIRIDRRDVFWSDAVAAAASWIAGRSGAPAPMPVPERAYLPLYSTWYNHHRAVSAAKVEKELAIAASLGMETAILDDGWQSDEDSHGFPMAGDWESARGKFPDMAAHVRAVHALGLKYMLWIAVPFAAFETKAFKRFKGKFLYCDDHRRLACLDPRFPDVREYLAEKCKRAVEEWGFDGLKLDFIDQMETRGWEDPAIAENFAGRDVKTVAEGVERLMKEIACRIRAVRRDALIEFRSAYFGPVLRQFGNIVRVADCPGRLAANRVGIVDLRLVCPGSCVHGDMIKWPEEATAEESARYILSSIFGTVQYSVALDGLDERKTKMIRHWIAFSKRHSGALQRGALRAHHPECDFPVIEGSDGKESVVLVSTSGFAADIPASMPAFVLNNTGSETLLLCAPAPRDGVVRDACGVETGTVSLPAGLTEVSVPVSGYLEFL